MSKKIKIILIIAAVFAVGSGLLRYFFASTDYYEYTADSSAECIDGELYDSNSGVCYFDYYCDTDQECQAVDDRYGKLLNALADSYANDHHTYQHSNRSDDFVKMGDAEVLIDPIIDNTLVRESLTQAKNRDTLRVEEILRAMLPVEYMNRIARIKEESDGSDGILAYVEPADSSGDKWVFGYDPVDAYAQSDPQSKKLKNPRELMTTLVHENMHIIALNSEQVAHIGQDVEYVDCPLTQTTIDEGCAHENSYIHAYIEKFWDESLREKTYQAQINHADQDFALAVYSKAPDHFVTEYAATNAVEDIAESFAFFVMRDSIENPTSIAEQKIIFFEQYPELVSVRKYMRGGIARVLEGI